LLNHCFHVPYQRLYKYIITSKTLSGNRKNNYSGRIPKY